MKNAKQIKGNRTMRERLEAMGMKMTHDDHPIYKLGPSIRFGNKKTLNKKNGEGDE